VAAVAFGDATREDTTKNEEDYRCSQISDEFLHGTTSTRVSWSSDYMAIV